MSRCKWIKEGRQCKSNAIRGTTLCLFHSQAKNTEGAAFIKPDVFVVDGERFKLCSLDDLCDFMTTVINDVRTGQLDEDKGKVIFVGAKELRLTMMARDNHKTPSGIEEMNDEDIIMELKNYHGEKENAG